MPPGRLLIMAGSGLLGGVTGAVEDAGGGADVHVEGDAVVGVAAMRDTSVASSFQVNRAVVQNTCRRLCQVPGLWT